MSPAPEQFIGLPTIGSLSNNNTGSTDTKCDAAIVAELNARKATNQANVDTLDEVIAKL